MLNWACIWDIGEVSAEVVGGKEVGASEIRCRVVIVVSSFRGDEETAKNG